MINPKYAIAVRQREQKSGDYYLFRTLQLNNIL